MAGCQMCLRCQSPAEVFPELKPLLGTLLLRLRALLGTLLLRLRVLRLRALLRLRTLLRRWYVLRLARLQLGPALHQTPQVDGASSPPSLLLWLLLRLLLRLLLL
jgi:hypothetical protein